jgi:lipoprotein-anchoring transpeptidase ErfK/SrfK
MLKYKNKQKLGGFMNKTLKFSLVWLGFFFSVVSLKAQTTANYDYQLVVDFQKMRLFLVTAKNDTIKSYPVCLPFVKLTLPLTGSVVSCEVNPVWRPTTKTRRAYFWHTGQNLPAEIIPGDTLNSLGAARINLLFDSTGINPAIKIHGTNKPKSIGQKISRGCIRLYNQDILELVGLIAHKKVLFCFH